MVEKRLQEQNSRTHLFRSGSSKTFPQYLATFLATLTAVSFGTHISWSSSAVLMLKRPESEIPISDVEGSWIGSIITLGALIGAIPTGSIAMRIGPKSTLQIISIPLLAAWYIIAFSGSLWGLYIARFLAGLGTGAVCVAAPMYIGELAETKIRGTLGAFFQLQVTVGLLIGYILGGTLHDFKILALVSSAVPIIFLLTFSFMPESPVFLSSKGHIKEARSALQYFRGPDYDVADELLLIRDRIQEAARNKGTMLELFTYKASSKAMVVSLALMFFQQMCGINAVLFYAESIFKQSGSVMPASVCAIVVGIVQVVATYLSSILMDRLGRRILLIISGSVMALCLGLLGVYFYLMQIHMDMSYYSFLPLACISIYLVVFSIGFGPIPWLMVGELFPSNTKGLASSISTAFNWTLAFAVTKVFKSMEETAGSGVTFGIFGLISLIGALFVIVYVPETKGKDVVEIQAILLGKSVQTITVLSPLDDCIKVSINMGSL